MTESTELTTNTRAPYTPWWELPAHLRTNSQKIAARRARRQLIWERMGKPGSPSDSEATRKALERWRKHREGKNGRSTEQDVRNALFSPPPPGRSQRVSVYEEAHDPSLPAERPLSPGDIRLFWRRMFNRDTAPLSASYHYRVRTAWRLAREFARLLGIVSESQTIAEAISHDEDPWRQQYPFMGAEEARAHQRVNADLVFVLRHADGHNQMPLAPPPVPEKWLDGRGNVKPEYNPENEEHDPLLHRWIWCAGRVVDMMGLNLATPGSARLDPPVAPDPESGRLGMIGLLDPKLVRLAFPSPEDIMTFEVDLAEITCDKLVEYGAIDVHKWLHAAFGLQAREQRSVVKMARARAALMSYGDPEEARAVMVMRLEKMLATARDCLDLDAQIKIQKQLQLVLGLGKVEPETRETTMAKIIGRISGERKPRKALPSSS
jgi:hypothetical protein